MSKLGLYHKSYLARKEKEKVLGRGNEHLYKGCNQEKMAHWRRGKFDTPGTFCGVGKRGEQKTNLERQAVVKPWRDL